jgi:hypothetical protein
MSHHELHENPASESREVICILYPHLLTDFGAIRHDGDVEHS